MSTVQPSGHGRFSVELVGQWSDERTPGDGAGLSFLRFATEQDAQAWCDQMNEPDGLTAWEVVDTGEVYWWQRLIRH